MIVALSHAAETELEKIGDYIARRNRLRAKSFVNELLMRCQRIADNPEAFPLAPSLESYRIRRLVHKGYLIFYRIKEDRIDILHIVHGAQDYVALPFLPD